MLNADILIYMNLVSRPELLVTTAQTNTETLEPKARAYAAELNAEFVERRERPIPALFSGRMDDCRLMIVQSERILLLDREGHEFFYHPNMAYPRLRNLLRGQRDLLIEAGRLKKDDSVLDATLGFASEAALCAHIVGDTGEVHGIEAVPEIGLMAREGLKTLTTESVELNAALRRIRVVHLGDHLEYLRSCPDRRYDIVCFDPFFEQEPGGSEQFGALRHFGDHAPLTLDAIKEAQRVARRRVLIKTLRWSSLLEEMGVMERLTTRSGIVMYGVLPPL